MAQSLSCHSTANLGLTYPFYITLPALRLLCLACLTSPFSLTSLSLYKPSNLTSSCLRLSLLVFLTWLSLPFQPADRPRKQSSSILLSHRNSIAKTPPLAFRFPTVARKEKLNRDRKKEAIRKEEEEEEGKQGPQHRPRHHRHLHPKKLHRLHNQLIAAVAAAAAAAATVVSHRQNTSRRHTGIVSYLVVPDLLGLMIPT